jgi:hypothetical protein
MSGVLDTGEDRLEEMGEILAKVRAGQHIDHLETIRVRKDGSVFPVSLTVSPILDADGTIIGTSMISRDMAELKHAARYFTDPDKARAGYSQAFVQGSLTDYPLTLRHRDGTLTDVECAVAAWIGETVSDTGNSFPSFRTRWESRCSTRLPAPILAPVQPDRVVICLFD